VKESLNKKFHSPRPTVRLFIHTIDQRLKFPRIIEMTAQNVVVVGIGAMGGGMACALLAASITRCVTGYDKSVDAVKTFFGESQAAKKAPSSMPSTMASAITESTDFVVLSLVNQGQCEQVCFGEGENLLNLVPKGSCVVMTSTVTGTSNVFVFFGNIKCPNLQVS
jgi:hypothetical protein